MRIRAYVYECVRMYLCFFVTMFSGISSAWNPWKQTDSCVSCDLRCHTLYVICERIQLFDFTNFGTNANKSNNDNTLFAPKITQSYGNTKSEWMNEWVKERGRQKQPRCQRILFDASEETDWSRDNFVFVFVYVNI